MWLIVSDAKVSEWADELDYGFTKSLNRCVHINTHGEYNFSCTRGFERRIAAT